MRTGILAAAIALALAAPLQATASDGVTLTMSKGPTPDVLTLFWVGGVSPFQAFDSANPATVLLPANLVGSTSSSPMQVPAGTEPLLFFVLTANCTPNPPEICNGIDDDCDGTADNHLTPPSGICSPFGVCSGQSIPVTCAGATGWHCNYSVVPNVEVDASGNLVANELRCDGRDGNCNGVIDHDGFPDLGQPCSVGLGPCLRNGTTVCAATQSSTRCTAIAGTPGTETCNGIDDDCDGTVDNHLTPPSNFCSNLGVCSGRTIPVNCLGATGWKCNYTGVPFVELDANGNLIATELLCDGRDGNCNGIVDDCH